MNDEIRKNINRVIANGKISHAYIFSGPAGTGKFDVVKDLVRTVNGEEIGSANENLIMVQCEIEKKKGKERKKDISVRQVREAVKRAGYFSEKGKKKFFIIKDADRLGDGAANSLLKIVEEPKSDTIIIFICEHQEKLLSTIRSRCQRIFLNLSDPEKISRYLEKKFPDVDKNKISEASFYSRGRYKLAESLLLDETLLKQKKETFEIFRRVIKSNWADGLDLAEKLSKNKEELLEVVDEWVWSLSDFLRKSVKENGNTPANKKITEMIKNLLDIKEKITGSNANEKIQLENFFIKTI